MSNLAKFPNIDPEFKDIYDSEVVEKEPKTPTSESPLVPDEDDLLALKRLAEIQKANQVDRKALKDGSFDQIENDISNAGKLFWDFMTR
jgi:hypothetical protein